MHQEDSAKTINRNDCQNIKLTERVLKQYQNIRTERFRLCIHNETNIYVQLRLSLLQTFFEQRGYLDLQYIDSIIRQTIQNFKNKHKQIKQEYLAILSNLCKQEIAHAERVEPEDDIEPIDIGEDDINAWLNSEFKE